MNSSPQGSRDRTVLVTGGAGFIGTNMVRRLLREPACRVVNVDKLTYAGSQANLAEVGEGERHRFYRADMTDLAAMRTILAESRPQAIVNLAAESHVDRSIAAPADFLHSNATGTFSLLEAARSYWGQLPDKERAEFRFLHVSTDEVYGSLGAEGRFTEEAPYRPNSPYAATKAASNHLVRAWNRTYGLPALVTNCSNNYGPFQFPEKLIPRVLLRALAGKTIPVFGRGDNVRDWLHVEDHVEALRLVIAKGRPGEVYNIGASCEIRNIDLVQQLCAILDRLAPKPDGSSYAVQIEFVSDRPGHDLRYAIDASKIRRELGWRPAIPFQEGLTRSVQWYLDHRDWSSAVIERQEVE